MTVNILGGVAKGFRVEVPRGGAVRPMAASLKRKPFDAHQDLSRYHFVDLCAGSGAVGLEAWSRGAKAVTFFEKKKRVYSALKDNIRRFHVHYPCSTRPLKPVLRDGLRWRQVISDADSLLLFFGPPYGEHQLYQDFLTDISEGQSFRGGLWVESDRQKGLSLSEIEDYLKPLKVYHRGTSFVCVFDFFDRC